MYLKSHQNKLLYLFLIMFVKNDIFLQFDLEIDLLTLKMNFNH